MPLFYFVAQDPSGVKRNGTTEAINSAEVVQELRGRGWLVLKVENSLPEKRLKPSFSVFQPKNWLRIRSIDVEIALQQLSVMLKSGISLLSAMEVVAKQSQREKMATVWREMETAVREGASLAEAMEKYRCFNRLTVQLVQVGEYSGQLETVLIRSAETLEHRRNRRSQMLHALAYPTIVFFAAIGVTIFMLVSVIPKIERFLSTLGRKLPPLTQLLVDISYYVVQYWLFTLLGGTILIFAFLAFYFWPEGRYWVDRIVLKIPILGRIFRLSGTILFSRTMATLIGSGLTILESLRLVAQLHYNKYLAERVQQTREYVLQGGSFAEPLALQGAYMPMLSSMVEIGETSGTLEQTLTDVAQFHEKQLQFMIRWLSTLIEPMIIIVVGGIVGFVYIAFFVALFGSAKL